MNLEANMKLHEQHTGVLEIKANVPVNNKLDLAEIYTPGISGIAKLLATQPNLRKKFTLSGKLIALITDGSAVLGLGNTGPAGGLPVIEGKSLIYKTFSGVDAIPIAIEQRDVDETVNTICNISGSFAGIHLEDIAAPKCFQIEERLKKCLEIPVYHDDQEGTAIVVLAGLINAAKVVHKSLDQLSIVINGVGAAGVATAQLLAFVGINNVRLVDIYGVVGLNSSEYNKYQTGLTNLFTKNQLQGTSLSEAIKSTDVFIGLSTKNVLTPLEVQTMNSNPIIFALANPIPEIDPLIAKNAGAKIIATGSGKYPNQINNILVFPGLFKGILEGKLEQINLEIEVKIARALAALIDCPSEDKIIPDVFDERVVPTIVATLTASKNS